MIYFEYSQQLVDRGEVPSTLCVIENPRPDARGFDYLMLADRVYEIIGRDVREIKNRTGLLKNFYIKEEDAIILRLKAVPV